MTSVWNWVSGRLAPAVLLLAAFESCGDPDREYDSGADDGQGGGGAPDTGSGGSDRGPVGGEAGALNAAGGTDASGGEAGSSGGTVGGAAGAGGEPSNPGRCTLSQPFEAPVFVPAFAETNLLNATLSADGLLIFFWQDSALYSTTRDDLDSQFGTPLEDELLAPASDWFKQSQGDDVPSISSDGLVLYADFGGQAQNYIWSASRESASEEFDAPVQEQALADTTRFSPFISHDGETLYFNQANHLHFARKEMSGFGTPKALTTLNSPSSEDQPILSADELTIFFMTYRTDGSAMGGADIWMSTREDIEDDFDAPHAVDDLNTEEDEQPVWLSEDGCEIWLSRSIDNPEGYRLMSARRPL